MKSTSKEFDQSLNERLARKILTEAFGFPEFRPGQYEIISQLARGKDVLAIMATGSGKSLCYQLPAMYWGGLTLVITPLIALMEDQVAKLEKQGLPAGCVHSSQSPLERARVRHELTSQSAYILYVSPERTASVSFAEWLAKQKLSLIAIDEAHCISQWGPEFRQEYHRLHRLREIHPKAPILALTATASLTVARDIMVHLKMRKPELIARGLSRPNLFLQVEHCISSSDKWILLNQSLQQFSQQKAIVYCGTRRQCEALAGAIARQCKTAVGIYHAGLDGKRRAAAQKLFERGELRIMVATSAFGMGVDYPDIGLIVHFNMPASLDQYCQEIGRAGRDGRLATSLALFSNQDRGLHAHFIRESQQTDHYIKQRWRDLDTVVSFANSRGCRESEMLRHFGGNRPQIHCGHCDHCAPKSSQRVRRPEVFLEALTSESWSES